MATYQGVSALEDTYSFAKDYDIPLREQSIIVTEEGYYPKHISAFVGERMRFFVTSTTDKDECFILKNMDLFLGAKKGKISEGEVHFTKPGVIEYYCPTGQLKGKLTVLEKPKKKSQRNIASERNSKSTNVRFWMPRDE